MDDRTAQALQTAVLEAAMEYDSANGNRRILSLAKEVKAKFPDTPGVTVLVLENMIWNVVKDI